MTVKNWSDYLDGDTEVPKGAAPAVVKAWGDLRNRLAACARELEEIWEIKSGVRTKAEQQVLYDAHQADPAHHALAAVPGTSNHEKGKAADVYVHNQPAAADARRQRVMVQHGLCWPVPGEAWHIEVVKTK